jgi:transposase, IS5 family
VIRQHAPRAQDFINRRGVVDPVERTQNRTKSKARAFDRGRQTDLGFAKACYRGLGKNAHRLLVTCRLPFGVSSSGAYTGQPNFGKAGRHT